MISISFATMTSGSSTVALEVAKSMIRSANSWRASASAACPSPPGSPPAARPPSRARPRSWRTRRRARAGASPGGRAAHLEMRLLALELLDPVVIGEVDVEALRLADLHPDEVVLPAGDHPFLADYERHAIRRAALERLAVDRADELHAAMSPAARRSSTGRSVACCSRRSAITASTCSSVISTARARTGSRHTSRGSLRAGPRPWP